jgi:hypothetical protein
LKYYPRVLAVVPPRGGRVYEFAVEWNHELGSLAKIVDTFAKRKSKVLTNTSQLDLKTNTAVGTFYCDSAKALGSAEDLEADIRKLNFVQNVQWASAEHSLFDQFLFPVTVWGRERVILMRLSPLLSIEKRLSQQLGSAGGAIIFSEGEEYAAETVGQYKKITVGASAGELMQNIKDGLRATGWGLFDFKRTKDGYLVTVKDAPVQDGMTEPSRFLCGIIAGILEKVFGIELKITESRFDQKDGSVVVSLSASR